MFPISKKGKGSTVILSKAAGLWPTIPLALLFFAVVCLLSSSTIKSMVMVIIIMTLALALIRFSSLRDRITPVVLALVLIMILDGVSIFYAVSGKFALNEFLKVLGALCLAFCLLTAAPGDDADAGRWIASVLEGFSALAGLVSIDLMSTRIVSGAYLNLLSLLSANYTNLQGVEAGVRMTSVFGNPNVFAGVAGLGTLLSLGLVQSARTKRERRVHLCCLYLSALSFVLAFSMGASGAIAVAFLSYLALERREKRQPLFVLMVETLVLTVLSAGVISMTSFEEWKGPQIVPLLCAALGAAALCASDSFLGVRLSDWLNRNSRGMMIGLGAVLVLVVGFPFVGYHMTGPVTLEAGEYLRRAAYPEPGEYTLSVQADKPLTVTIESQNQQETMMHTSTPLYAGPADGADYTVPEDSLVVYFNFLSEDATRFETAVYQGAEQGSIPLGYKLLPGFIANRLQGLFANQNAIQRFVFFSDGMKLFHRSPVYGLGIGAFENAVMSVQSFHYETKYAHNHYIQALVETGLLGLAAFLGLIAVSAVSVWRARKLEMVPMLGAALVFMAGHAAVEVVFSEFAYLPIAFGVFALIGLCTREALPKRKQFMTVQTASVCAFMVLIAVFAILLSRNMQAASLVRNSPTLDAMREAAEMDPFERADYELSYVLNARSSGAGGEVSEQAEIYAGHLSKMNSNSIPRYLADYYLSCGRMEEGFRMAEKYVTYTASNPDTWQYIFDMLAAYEEDSEEYRTGVLHIVELLNQWNRENMGTIQLSEAAIIFIARMGGVVE